VPLTGNRVGGFGLTDNPGLANPPALGSFSAGVATGTTHGWSKAGVITLTPSLVDVEYLGVRSVTGTTSGNVGRSLRQSPSFVRFNAH
jgi:hypothetical protein